MVLGLIKTKHISIVYQIAGIFTKPLPRRSFEQLLSKLGEEVNPIPSLRGMKSNTTFFPSQCQNKSPEGVWWSSPTTVFSPTYFVIWGSWYGKTARDYLKPFQAFLIFTCWIRSTLLLPLQLLQSILSKSFVLWALYISYVLVLKMLSNQSIIRSYFHLSCFLNNLFIEKPLE